MRLSVDRFSLQTVYYWNLLPILFTIITIIIIESFGELFRSEHCGSIILINPLKRPLATRVRAWVIYHGEFQ